MKNKINLSQLYESCKKWKTLVLLGAMLLIGINQAWAGAGWINEKGVELTFSIDGVETTRELTSSSAGGSSNLGTATTGITLTKFKAFVWRDGGNICNTQMFYRVKNSGGTTVIDHWSSAIYAPYSSQNGNNQVWQKTDLNENLASGLSAGTYTFECTFIAKGDYNNNGCDATFNFNNGGSNYSYTFTIGTQTYHVTYNKNGGTGTEPNDNNDYESGDEVEIAGNTNLEKSGYVFAGWNTAANGSGTYYVPGATFSITSSTKLYAVWLDENVLDGTNVMFYIQGYDNGGYNYLVNSSGATVSTSTPITKAVSYVNTNTTNLSSYDRISNNAPSWNGKENTAITTATGGQYFWAHDKTGSYSAKTAATTATPDGDDLDISTTCNSATGVYDNRALYILYYLEDEIVDVTYSGTPTMAIPASTSAQESTYDISELAEGDYTIYTILTDGIIFYIADNTDFTVSPPPATCNVTYNANYPATASSTGGGVPIDNTNYETGETVTVKTNSGNLSAGGFTFAGWNTRADGSGTTYSATVPLGTFTISNNITLYAKWNEIMTTVTVNVSPAGAGTLTVDGNDFTAGNTTTAGRKTSRTVVATAESGKIFQEWVVGGNATGSKSTNTYTLKGNGSGSTGTLTAKFGVASGWYLKGHQFGGWSSPTENQFTYSYRGITNIEYIPLETFNGGNGDYYWRVYTGSTQYNTSSSTNNDKTDIVKGTIYTLYTNASKASRLSSPLSNVWVVLDRRNSTKKLWIQDQQTYYNVNVTNDGDGTKGTYKVTLNSTSAFTQGSNVFETTQYANGEGFKVTVTGVDGWIPTITIGGVATTFWQQASTYEATGTMSTSDVAVSITYTASYAVTFATTTGGASITATGPNSTTITTGTKVKSGTSITFTQTKNSGYDFSKWYSTTSGTGGTDHGGNSSGVTLSISAATSVYPIYTAHTYTGGKLDRKEGSVDGSYSVTYLSTTITPSAPTRTGYQPSGYYEETGRSTLVADAEGNLKASTGYTDGSKRWTYTSTETPPDLFTQWQAKTYTSENNLKKNGGDSDGKFTATYDATNIVINTAPEKTGYHVVGYYLEPAGTNKVATEGGALQASQGSLTDVSNKWKYDANDAVLYATWAPSTYTVTFNQHGTDETTIYGTSSVTATYDAEMPAITVPKKVGYTFGGYFTGENGTGTQYYNEIGEAKTDAGVTTIWNIASPTTLHAKWTGIGYQVEFDANGGAGSISPQALVYGTPTALTSNTTQITRDGYFFLGWNTNADGSGTKFHNGKEVSDLASSQGATVTLYAQWAKTQTLYFLNEGTSGWNQGSGSAASATRYAYAFISYDGQVMYPIGTWETSPRSQGKQMTATASSIYLPHVSSGIYTWCWSIDDVPEGATIVFSDNTGDTYKTGNLSGWTSEKPYYCNSNGTWYALDGENTISMMSEMSVYVNGSYHGIDFHGTEEYAIVEFSDIRNYNYKYFNWRESKWSGNQYKDAYIMNQYTTTGISPTWGLNGENGGNDVLFYAPVKGEYKFKLTWDGSTPQTTLYYPVGVALALNKTSAPIGESTTIRLTASPQADYLVTSPTYYYQISKDNTNWTTIATTSEATYDYTFAAQNCKFRVILQNDEGLKSASTTQDFTSFSTRSFYVYNPYTESGWGTLYLYTWNGNTKYNGNSFPGYDAANCINGNKIESKGGNWFYITINESASCYILSGGDNNHQTVTCFTSNYKQDGKYMIFTENNANYIRDYKAKGEYDFRLRYSYEDKARYSDIYNTYIDGTAITNGKAFMSSMWMNANDNTASITIEQGTGNDTWEDRVTYSNSTEDGFEGIVPSGKRDKGYVFQMKMNINTTTVTSSTLSDVAVYNGSFYVRTDGLNGGWNVYKKADHTMHYSEISLTQSTPAFDYSLCKWIGSGETNVKFTVGNEYNSELVASLEGDIAITEPLYNRQTIPTATNVRFSYNSHTNTLTRAYLSAASSSSRFLVMVETTSPTLGKIYTASGLDIVSGQGKDPNLNEHELIFSDNGNWVYQLDMMANPGAYAKVTAKYNKKEPEFIASAELIGGTGETKEKYRVVYDFKTNILTSAWMPNGAISGDLSLNTNIMLIRKGQDAADQISCSTHKITDAKRLIGVMQFDYNDMVGKMSSWNTTARQYCMYYISFPFDVNVSDIFGAGSYGVDWRLQYYDGADRAARGFFRGDGTTTFWKDVPANGKLSANVGYSLLLNRINFNNSSSEIWENKSSGSKVYLYFPSTTELTVSQVIKTGDAQVYVTPHECTIQSTFEASAGRTVSHAFTDSHWNMMGVPLFESAVSSDGAKFIPEYAPGGHDTTPFDEGEEGYFYEWDYATNTFSVQEASTYKFKSMHGYMVQYAGYVNYVGSSIQAAVAARRLPSEQKNYKIDLQLMQDDNRVSRTYVELRDEACDTFALNEDVYMMYTSRPADIYSYAGNYDVSANVVSVKDHVIPVGVEVHNAGMFTFTMPSNFDGTAVLMDSQTGARTNLALGDYNVSLNKGNYNDRFYLEINIHNAPTIIEAVTGDELQTTGVRKVLINGTMYIVRDGKMYDARGARVE